MNEVDIEIEVLIGRKLDLESKVYSMTEYGRSPSDSNYDEMLLILSKRALVVSQIDSLQGVSDSIRFNLASSQKS